MRRSGVCAGVLAGLCGGALGANVYVMSSGDPATDSAAVTALTSRGHTATVGVAYWQFDGSQSLAGFQTVYMQANANWTSPDMPAAGQGTLAAWVTDGGRLVTSEWVLWKAAIQGNYVQLAPMFPVVPSG